MASLRFTYIPPGEAPVTGSLHLDDDELAAFVAGVGLPANYGDDIEWED